MMTPVKKSIAISPVEFYGNAALPRPRFFDDPQFDSHRVDSPFPALDPLLSRARDAYWSNGGINSTRLRLQGRIEGDVDKLLAQLESSSPGDSEKKKRRSGCDSPPAAPVKRRRYLDVNDDEEEDEGVERIIRNLFDDFDRVAGRESKITKKSIESAGKRLKEKKKKTLRVEETSSTRITSPRLTKSLYFR